MNVTETEICELYLKIIFFRLCSCACAAYIFISLSQSFVVFIHICGTSIITTNGKNIICLRNKNKKF